MVQMLNTQEVILVRHINSTINPFSDEVLLNTSAMRYCCCVPSYQAMKLMEDC